MMNLDFEIIIWYAIIVSGAIALIDILFLAAKRKRSPSKKMPLIIEYARSLFPIFVVVFLIRSFLFESYHIPSGSLKPTLLVGDFIIVNKFDYGIRLPVLHKKVFAINEPKHGDIVVFRAPPEPSKDYIKRVIGIPGDHIQYVNKILFINGKEILQKFEKNGVDQSENNLEHWDVIQKNEVLFGINHEIFQIPTKDNDNFDITVPAGKYFMMGDNRDDSDDSRVWGFLPEENIIGKAVRVGISFDSINHPIRWDRIGKKIV